MNHKKVDEKLRTYADGAKFSYIEKSFIALLASEYCQQWKNVSVIKTISFQISFKDLRLFLVIWLRVCDCKSNYGLWYTPFYGY